MLENTRTSNAELRTAKPPKSPLHFLDFLLQLLVSCAMNFNFKFARVSLCRRQKYIHIWNPYRKWTRFRHLFWSISMILYFCVCLFERKLHGIIQFGLLYEPIWIWNASQLARKKVKACCLALGTNIFA